MDDRPIPASSGHLFIIDGDVTSLSCDAWLLPTDEFFSITPAFCKSVGLTSAGVLEQAIVRGGFAEAGCVLWQEGGAPGQPDLWLGDVGRVASPLAHYSQRADEFIERASRHLAQRLTSDRPALVAINVLGSGSGGKRSERGPLLQALIPSMLGSARRNACDVVLVTHGSVMYSAAQKVRRELSAEDNRFWISLPSALDAPAAVLAERARNHELVTFFGAGVGADVGMPTWRQLLRDVAQQLPGFDMSTFESLGDMDPRDQATVLERRSGGAFRAAVAKALSSERYSLTHGLLASLPTREAITTNFDDLYERAARTAGRTLVVLPGGHLEPGGRWLLKLHGTLGKDLVLTRDEYLGALSTHTALRGLVQAMLLTRKMAFIGYSLKDEDFHQLVHEVRSAFGQTEVTDLGTVLTLSQTPHFSDLWPELRVVSMAEHEPALTDQNDQARRLRVFLDRVGALAASDVVFVADDSMGELRSDEEIRLAEIVGELDDLLRSKGGTSGEWAIVRDFVDSFRPRDGA